MTDKMLILYMSLPARGRLSEWYYIYHTKCTRFKGGIDVTDRIPDSNFKWNRISNNLQSDELWNSTEHIGKKLEISAEDVYRKAVFDCEITLSDS